MNYELIQASKKYEDIIRNLMQFYIYDFSEFVKCDVEDDGLFREYPYLEDYWKEVNHRFPYVIKQEDKYIGFVFVRFIESEERNYYSIAEFFIMKKYRKEGIGKAVAKQIFDFHKGQWEVYQLESNKPAQVFWNKVINEYTQGEFKDRIENNRKIQDFNS
ncbi:GNAT family N-acetyltransferase [Paenibacillus sp. D2_2]|uniref:GNAT family N-acetyltransferase n=1 Tax=Paenibacillus sp. D2_2 TaxID=3073092 RepID=UPI00281690E2|nr:GNAT family N-acetyltransferase [Paenibacillus sp. D2_2]WMT39733.1 GNAT family N-acetyltransferase [Paenibacillus sp. D2_2]